MQQAIAKWSKDLEHLKQTFTPRFEAVSWPTLKNQERPDDGPPDLFGG